MNDDLISRQAAIDAVEKWFFDTTDPRQPKEVLCCLPSAQSERMGKFITLTVEHNGQPVLVNIDRIETVHQDYTLKTETTYIELGDNSLAVQESVESVANLIRRAEKTDR